MPRDKLRNPDLQGIIILDKPAGFTSQDAVSKARAVLRIKKMGHGGTLDPFATGVLPLMVNSATRIAPLLGSDVKVYEGVMHLGVATDTLDPTGKVLAEKPVEGIDQARIEEVLASFVGDIQQVPPMFSAVKIKGKRLYELARKGEEVERKAKEVTVHELELLGVDLPRVSFRVRCSTGTYVRVIVSDAGEKLGCGAHLAELVRTRSGRFGIDDAIDVERLHELGGRFRGAENDHEPHEDGRRWRFDHGEATRWWEAELGDCLQFLPRATGLPTVQFPAPVLARVRHGEPIRAGDVTPAMDLAFEAGDELLVTPDGDHVTAIVRAACRAAVAPKLPDRTPVLEIVRVLRT